MEGKVQVLSCAHLFGRPVAKCLCDLLPPSDFLLLRREHLQQVLKLGLLLHSPQLVEGLTSITLSAPDVQPLLGDFAGAGQGWGGEGKGGEGREGVGEKQLFTSSYSM